MSSYFLSASFIKILVGCIIVEKINKQEGTLPLFENPANDPLVPKSLDNTHYNNTDRHIFFEEDTFHIG